MTRQQIEQLREFVTRDFGPKCPDFCYACHVCVVHMAVDILDDAYWASDQENVDQPSRHKPPLSPADDRALTPATRQQ